MGKIRDSVKLFDFTTFEFPEFLLSNLGSDRRLPFWSKCIGLSFFLYGAGVVATAVSNTLLPWTGTNVETPFIYDYSFLIVCAVMGCTLAVFISTLHKLDDAMMQVSKRIGALSTPDGEQKFKEYISYIRRWMPVGERFFEKPSFWYYLDTIGGALLGALFAIYWSIYSKQLWWGRAQFAVAAFYFIFFCAVVAYAEGEQ